MQDKAKISQKKWQYLAGYMDGDGSFSIGSHPHKNNYINYDVHLTISSVHKPTAKWLIDVFGGQIVNSQDKRPNRKPAQQWYVSNSTHQLSILSGVTPFLKLKQRQAEILTEFLNLGGRTFQNPEIRKVLVDEIKQRNTYFLPVYRTSALVNQCGADRSDYQYFAGILDAEGCISLYENKRSFDPKLQLANTDMRVFDFLLDRFGGSVTTVKRENRALGNWSLPTKFLESTLLATIPYLVTKRAQGMLLLNWLRSRKTISDTESREHISRFRELNFRGISPTTNTTDCPEKWTGDRV